VIRLVAVFLAALAFAPAAFACTSHPTLSALEGQVMCPVCGTTLDQSDSPAAHQIERVISGRIAAGDTDCQIKNRLVAQYGESILASPPHHGFGLLAWWLPLAGIIVAAIALAAGVWRWSQAREVEPAPAAGGALDPVLERRLDEELRRYDE
jgi:cytochrome c-type biogenesis protein CcmH